MQLVKSVKKVSTIRRTVAIIRLCADGPADLFTSQAVEQIRFVVQSPNSAQACISPRERAVAPSPQLANRTIP